MKKVQLLGIALVAMFAFSVFTAASASAAVTFLLAEWLVNGAAVTTEQAVEAEGTVLLEDTNAPGGASDIECGGIAMGVIGPDGLGRLSEVLTLDGLTKISNTALVEPGMACTKLTGICEEPLIWGINLPWDGLLELMEDGTEKFFVVLGENSGTGALGWYVHCMKTILEPHDECVASENPVGQLSLEGGSLLLGGVSEAFTELAGVKLVTCSLGGAESGILESIPQEIKLAGGGTLSASSETEEV